MVRFINCFEVPDGRDDDFLALFGVVNAHMSAQRGYLGHQLHRSLSPDARFRFVNYVEWATAEDWRNAHGEEFRRLVSDPEWRAFPTTPALYEIVHEGARS
ncbi:antibiotic biosynthesis monooxygenase family protein [Petropleomorpha daqingensis]|uniref:Heme-degrading monooxygenase HmoA n=1 Tax=Petropleomorpha daqingensis TaxID=2026353 RepID=A0A853CJ15_9ACTN|nr:heme-degrading monooxygenase HmoA [Petropleomorpha daqingensis]